MPPLRLRAIAGARRGQEFVFFGPRVRIGRGRDNDLIFPERGSTPTSRGHEAEALLDASGIWWIVDLGSASGTLLNGVVVQRHELHDGDRITLGDDLLAVSIGRSPQVWSWTLAVGIIAVALIGTVWIERRRNRPSFEDVAAAAARSVFMVAIDENGRRSIMGTGFVIAGDGILVTNAHVADALVKRRALPAATAGVRALAVQCETYDARALVSASVHTDWRPGSLRADVALLRLEPGAALAPLRLADAGAIAMLRRGSPLATLGFPAPSTDRAKPRARLRVDVVGEVRGNYVDVGLGVAPGTSGSPIFDESGSVVAVLAGGDFVDAPDGASRSSGSPANWALGVRVVRELLASTR